jgi:predicted Zn-dependent protease
MREAFYELAEHAIGRLRGDEVLLANFAGETSDFVRFNRAQVRQPMTIVQAYLSLTLIDGRRRATVKLALAGDGQSDRSAADRAMQELRAELPALPEDPYLRYATEVHSSERTAAGRMPAPEEALDTIIDAAAGSDLVGIFAAGRIARGFANSLGQRNWHEVDSFNFEWSLYHSGDKAVKAAYAGEHWDGAEAARRIEAARAQLAYMARPPKKIEPGAYRAYLAPAALDELLWMLNWGGVSAKAQRTKQSPLQRLVDGEARLSAKFSLRENTAAGLAPAFDAVGFVKPARVELVAAGRHAGSLVSPRTAQEYGLEANGANDEETMSSLEVDGGGLPATDALAALDSGVYIGNLWYLNYSDRPNCRITGMTRFGTFWVENGAIVAPLAVMRFDDSLYRMLGQNLIDFTREREWILNSGTYGERSVETSRVPGALLAALDFTL